jgi:hypothetical protein
MQRLIWKERIDHNFPFKKKVPGTELQALSTEVASLTHCIVGCFRFGQLVVCVAQNIFLSDFASIANAGIIKLQAQEKSSRKLMSLSRSCFTVTLKRLVCIKAPVCDVGQLTHVAL